MPMDKLVNRVTVVQGSGPTREVKTVYDGREDEFPSIPIDGIVRSVTVIEGTGALRRSKLVFRSRYWEEHDGSWRDGERGMRRFLKADMIRAQEAYRRHRESASDDKQLWWLDLPANMVRAFIKAGKKTRKDRADNRADDADVAVSTVQADMHHLKDDLTSTAGGIKRDAKSKAFDTKIKVKGA
jgi:hypothetical protein